MNSIIEEALKNKFSLLVDFILEKNPNANKEYINSKINELLNGITIPKKTQKKEIIKKIKVLDNHILNSVREKNLTLKVKKSHYSNHILYLDDEKFTDLNQAKLIFIPTIKVVVGFETIDGRIEPLDKDLIEICHKYKLKYKIPLNLNIHNSKEDSVIVDEMQELGLNIIESDDETDNDD